MSEAAEPTLITNSAQFSVIAHNVVGMYAEPNPSSELISQLLSGMRMRVIEWCESMALVEGEDRYRGWVRSGHLAALRDDSDSPKTTIAALIADIHTSAAADARLMTKLTVATPVVLARHSSVRSFTPILLPGGETGYTHKANLSSSYMTLGTPGIPGGASPDRQTSVQERAALIRMVGASAIEAALRLVGTPYLWGGATPFGIDCSGLTQLCFRISGLQLRRDASLQFTDRRFGSAQHGAPLAEALFDPGDLLFFFSRSDSSRTKIGHVGMAIGDGRFVHAAGGGRGTIVTECGDPEWTGIYAGDRRLLANADVSIDAA